MDKLDRVKVIKIEWDDKEAMRVLKNRHNKVLFKLRREEYIDERERDSLIGEVMNLQNQIEDY